MKFTHTSPQKNRLKKWHVLLLPAILYIMAGLSTFAIPSESNAALSLIFCISIFVSAISEINFFLRIRKKAIYREGHLLAGMLDLVMVLLLLAYPEALLSFLPFYMGIWLLFRSIVEIGFPYRYKLFGKLDWLWLFLLVSGLVYFFFLLMENTINGSMNAANITGLAFVVVGAFRLFLAFDIKMVHGFKSKYRQISLSNK